MASTETIVAVVEKIQSLYDNWRVTEAKVKIWTEYLSEVDDEILEQSFDRFLKTSGSSYPPELPVIIKLCREIKASQPTEWRGLQTPFALAIESGNYVPKPPRPQKKEKQN